MQSPLSPGLHEIVGRVSTIVRADLNINQGETTNYWRVKLIQAPEALRYLFRGHYINFRVLKWSSLPHAGKHLLSVIAQRAIFPGKKGYENRMGVGTRDSLIDGS